MNAQAPVAPPLAVRMAAAVYEGMLLFGVLACAALLYGLVVRPDGNSNWGWPFYLVMAVVMGGYFVWFWSKGETLAMATWHLRLQRRGQTQTPTAPQALIRFLVSQLWWLPGLATVHLLGLDGERSALWSILLANVAGYALATRLHPSRQYLHDLVAGTEMVRHFRQPKKKGP